MGYIASGYVAVGYIADHATRYNPFIAWDNRLSDAVPVASSTTSGAAANLSDFRPYTSWKPGAIPATITVDCGAAKSANSLSVFNHDLFANSCWIEVRGSSDNFVASDDLLSTFSPLSDKPFCKYFNAASYRYWRIRVVGISLPTLSIVAIGTALEFPIGLPYGFDPLGRKVFGQTNISEAGLPLGKAILFRQWDQTLNFARVDSAWVRSTFIPAWNSGLEGNPFIFAWNLTDFPNDVWLLEAGDSFKAPQVLPTYNQLSFGVKGIALP